jgi:hypothetical protein
VVELVAPFHGDGVFGQLGNELGALDDDVAPKLHRVAASRNGSMNLLQEVEVDALGATLFTRLLAAAEAQVEGLVEADIEDLAREVRQQLVIQVVQES